MDELVGGPFEYDTPLSDASGEASPGPEYAVMDAAKAVIELRTLAQRHDMDTDDPYIYLVCTEVANWIEDQEREIEKVRRRAESWDVHAKAIEANLSLIGRERTAYREQLVALRRAVRGWLSRLRIEGQREFPPCFIRPSEEYLEELDGMVGRE